MASLDTPGWPTAAELTVSHEPTHKVGIHPNAYECAAINKDRLGYGSIKFCCVLRPAGLRTIENILSVRGDDEVVGKNRFLKKKKEKRK